MSETTPPGDRRRQPGRMKTARVTALRLANEAGGVYYAERVTVNGQQCYRMVRPDGPDRILCRAEVDSYVAGLRDGAETVIHQLEAVLTQVLASPKMRGPNQLGPMLRSVLEEQCAAPLRRAEEHIQSGGEADVS